ncbi:MAG: potassium transporter TrkA [Chloroflexales bacterium]|nr:potassium transporter TrkA [Chloroflexales bacterium]
MYKVSLNDRLRYAFDNTMSKGTIALIGLLGALSMLVVVVVALFVTVVGIRPEGGEQLSFPEAVWQSLMRTLDSGTMGGDIGWSFRIAMLVVTFGGIFVISTLIGVLTSGIEGKVEALRKGRSHAVENGHIVILGWSQQIFVVISELIAANTSLSKSCIVIMGDKDKVEMEEEIRDNVGPTGHTRIVCRRGNPMSLSDLEIVSPHTARSLIVLAPEGDNPDSSVIKTLLAITNNPRRRSEPYHIVAEIRDAKNIEVSRMVGRDEAELVLTGDLVSRIIAQTCRQSGLSIVYTELLDFDGDEIYFHTEPELVGKTFGAALLAYEESAVIGLHQRGAAPQLNPPMDTLIGAGDQLIVISEDDNTIRLAGAGRATVATDAIQLRQPAQPTPERTLILGWNWRAPAIINELDRYVAAGSVVMVVANTSSTEEALAQHCANLVNQTVTFQSGDTTDRRTLDTIAIDTYKHVIVLCYSDTLDAQQADANTLITLLHLRDIANHSQQPFSMVSEMLDTRNRVLAEVTRADDFIVSDKLVSLILAQVSENKALNAVFTDLFDPEGAEVYLKLVSDYVRLGEPLNFYTVAEAARQRNEVALGYRLMNHAKDPAQAYGVVVNPNKSQPITFSEWDRVIVLADN